MKTYRSKIEGSIQGDPITATVITNHPLAYGAEIWPKGWKHKITVHKVEATASTRPEIGDLLAWK